MKCIFCKEEISVRPFAPVSDRTGKELFEKNHWFFAYCTCGCGTFIIEKEWIAEKQKKEKEND